MQYNTLVKRISAVSIGKLTQILHPVPNEILHTWSQKKPIFSGLLHFFPGRTPPCIDQILKNVFKNYEILCFLLYLPQLCLVCTLLYMSNHIPTHFVYIILPSRPQIRDFSDIIMAESAWGSKVPGKAASHLPEFFCLPVCLSALPGTFNRKILP